MKEFCKEAEFLFLIVQIDNEKSLIQTVLLTELALNWKIFVRIIICSSHYHNIHTGETITEETSIEFLSQFIKDKYPVIKLHQVALNEWTDDGEEDFIIDTSGTLISCLKELIAEDKSTDSKAKKI